MRKLVVLGLVLVATASVGLSYLHWSGKTRFQSKIVEELHGMPENTGEESRRHVRVDGLIRRTDIVFKDGCVVRKLLAGTAADGSAVLTEAIEIRQDGSKVVYKFEADGKTPSSRTQYRKDGTRYSVFRKEGNANVCRFYHEDGRTLRGVFRPNSNGYEFTTYDSAGEKLYDEVRRVEAPPPPQGQENTGEENAGHEPSGQPTKIHLTYTVFNGGAYPLYRQTWLNEYYSEGGEGQYEGSNASLEMLEEMHQGTTLPLRQFVFGAYTTVGDSSFSATVVTVFGSNGQGAYVRYLDDKRRIRRTVDKTVTPELTTDIKESEAVQETLDESRIASLDDEQSMTMKQEAASGGDHSHLDRILLP